MLDHVLLSSWYRSCLQDVRTRRGKLTLTDHALLTTHLDLELQNSKFRKPEINPTKLHDEVIRTEFNELVKGNLHETGDNDDLEQSWLIFCSALSEATSIVLVQDRKEKKPWISKETIDLFIKRGKLQLRKKLMQSGGFFETNLFKETNSSKAEVLVELSDTKYNKAEAMLEFEHCCKLMRKAVRKSWSLSR